MYSHQLIVIGVPVYNEETYLFEALESIRLQSHLDFLVAISDNCSSDNSYSIALSFAMQDARFVAFRQKVNIGASNNFKYLYECSDSPYFVWIGAHDCLAPDFLEKHIGFLLQNKGYALSYSDIDIIDERGRALGVSDGSSLDQLTSSCALSRYIGSIPILYNCTAINHPFRREALFGFGFPVVQACDHIAISRIAFAGKINRFLPPLYKRRYFSDRALSQFERISSMSIHAPLDQRLIQTRREYLRDYMCLPVPLAWRLLFYPLTLFFVDKEFGLGLFRLVRLIGQCWRWLRAKR